MTKQDTDGQRLKRRSRPDTRRLMLVAGALLAEAYAMGEAPYRVQPALSHIGFDEVLELATKLQLHFEAAGRTLSDAEFDALQYGREHLADIRAMEIDNVKVISRGSAYFAFDDESDYRSKLVDYLLAADLWPDIEVWEQAFVDLVERNGGALPPFEAALRATVQASFDHWVHRPGPLLEMALAQFALEPELTGAFVTSADRARHGTADEPGLDRWLADFLARYDRVLDRGIDVDGLTTMVMCIIYGFLFGARTDPAAVVGSIDWSDSDVSLPALAVEAVVTYVTSVSSPILGGDQPAE